MIFDVVPKLNPSNDAQELERAGCISHMGGSNKKVNAMVILVDLAHVKRLYSVSVGHRPLRIGESLIKKVDTLEVCRHPSVPHSASQVVM